MSIFNETIAISREKKRVKNRIIQRVNKQDCIYTYVKSCRKIQDAYCQEFIVFAVNIWSGLPQ